MALQQSSAPGSDPGQTKPGAPFEGGRPDEEDIFPDQSPGGETEADEADHAARGERWVQNKRLSGR